MPQISRRHHYVPQFYLAGFSPSGRKDDHLVIVDGRKPSRFVTTPANVAHERDFYAVESEELPLDTFEKALAEFESKVKPVIAGIQDTLALPGDDDMAYLLNFVAFMAVRTPRIRIWYSNFTKDIRVARAKSMLSSPDRIREIARMHPECGVDPNDDATIQALHNVPNTHNIEVSIPTNYHFETLMKLHEKMLPYLFSRRWNIQLAMPDAGDFICSDHPVGLTWTKPVRSRFPPTIAQKNTAVIFPLSKRLCLVGDFEGAEIGSAIPANSHIVACSNTAILMSTYRFVFSSKPDFPWFNAPGSLGDADQILATVHRNFKAVDSIIRNPVETK